MSQEQHALVPNELIIDSTLSDNAKKVYCIISVNYFGKDVKYSLENLSNEVGITKRGIGKILDKMEEAGYLHACSSKGRNNCTVFKLLIHPTLNKSLKFTKVPRSKIYGFDSRNLLLFVTFKMIYDVLDDYQFESFIKANCSTSPWYSVEQVFSVVNTLAEIKAIDFKYKVSMFREENIKKEDRLRDKASNNNTNIQQDKALFTTERKYTECGLPLKYKENGEVDYEATYPWRSNADWKKFNREIDSAESNINDYEKKQDLTAEETEVLAVCKNVYHDRLARVQLIEQQYRNKILTEES